jgi:hypothetical protein
MCIVQDPDDRWRIGWETAIKAKSVTGLVALPPLTVLTFATRRYSTYNRKLTQNRFIEGEEKPELLDDWDQRLVVSCLERGKDGKSLTITQAAEKDQVQYH